VSAKPPASPHQTAAEISRVSAVRPVHRVACDGCGWVGYRRNPWGRDCPSCGIDGSKLRPVWLAGVAPRRGRCCYLGHIWPAYGHAQHYLGFTTNLPRRWPAHLAGGYDPLTHKATGRGARLLAAAVYAGCTVELVRVWYGQQARALEQRLKQRRQPDAGSLRAGAKTSLKPLCPVCNPGRALRRYPDLPDPPPPPRPGRFVHDPKVWDADREWDLAFPHLADGTPARAPHAATRPDPQSARTRANPADQEDTMRHNPPIDPDEVFIQLNPEERLPRSLAQYWASDRDQTGELMQEQELLAEQADAIEEFIGLNPSLSLLRASDPRDFAAGVRSMEADDALGERVTVELLLGENFRGIHHRLTPDDVPDPERDRTVRMDTLRERAQAAQHDHDRQAAFAQLNPDFGVLPDARHPQQHRFAQQRERALALGERVAAAEQSGPERGEPSDIVSFPRLPATPQATAERATDRREEVRQRLLEGYQRRQAAREQRPPARASKSTPTRARPNPAEQERDR
jgi:hypothetical protein